MSLYHSLYSNWEGFKDSSISADSGHEGVGMMGGGGGGGGCSTAMSPSRCFCIYSCIVVLKLHVCCVSKYQLSTACIPMEAMSVNALCINSTVAQSFQIFEIG